MNFYKHHLGDYDGATAHLSWDEDMAYTRLLRAYYRREKPLADIAEACRLVRATSKGQRIAVDAVLKEFFTTADDGWHNKRADEEITAYQAQASTNKRIARERIVKRTVDESLTKGPPATLEKREPNQEPLTKNQEPERSRAEARASRLPSDWTLPDEWASWAESERQWSREQVQAVADRFRDHWIAKPGADGRKMDWLATWRNWVRNERVNGAKHGHSDGGLRAGDSERSAARRAILQPASPSERDVTGDSERVD